MTSCLYPPHHNTKSIRNTVANLSKWGGLFSCILLMFLCIKIPCTGTAKTGYEAGKADRRIETGSGVLPSDGKGLRLFTSLHSISGFSPGSGQVGTTVVISGTDFSPVPSNNIVFFGAVKSTVVAAGSTSLTVIVPAGASYSPISVTINNLTVYSVNPFIVTFNCGSPLSVTSLAPPKRLQIYGPSTWKIGTADLDGDGKPDIVSGNYNGATNSNMVSIFRNTGIPGNTSFATRQDIVSGAKTDDVIEADFDGNGLLDLIVLNEQEPVNTLSVFRNTSNIGNIQFAAPSFLYAASSPLYSISYGDINGDGKPDIIGNYFESILIFSNTSTNGSISFAPPVSVPTNISLQFASACGDLDGDGKADIVLTNSAGSSISVLKNTSISGGISFAAPVAYPTGLNPGDIAIGDMDGDGKADVISTNKADITITLYRNTSTPGTISLTQRTDYSVGTGNHPFKLAITDFDGDGKPDMISVFSNLIAVIKNTSASGSFSFAPKQTYPVSFAGQNLATGDMDLDGKTDIVTGGGTFAAGSQSQYISIFNNRLCVLIPFCPGGSNSLVSPLTGSSYQWQVNTGSGFVNITDDANYTGSQTAVLQLNNIPSTWTGYKYRCVVDATNSNEMNIRFVNTWTGAVSTAWENPQNWSCGSVPDANTDVYITSGTVVLSSSTTINTIAVSPGVSFTVTTGNTLTVLH